MSRDAEHQLVRRGRASPVSAGYPTLWHVGWASLACTLLGKLRQAEIGGRGLQPYHRPVPCPK